MEILNKTYNTRKILSQWKWVILGIFSLGVRWLAAYTPQSVESIYSRGVFPIIRWVFDISLAFSPIPLIYLFYAIIFYFIIKTIAFQFKKSIPLSIRLKKNAFSVLSFTGFMVFWFLFLWGYNYARVPFQKQMNIEVSQLDSTSLEKELIKAAQEAIDSRTQLNTKESIPLLPHPVRSDIKPDFEDKIREDISKMLQNKGFIAGGNLRGRGLTPDGILFRFGISGIYMPYVGESNIDGGMHPLEKPFTMAHEMAHGYGWTDEATANFVAYLTCIGSDDAYTKYSGYLMYFRYVASNYRRINTEGYKKFRETLPAEMINDLKAINARIEQFPTWFETDGLNNIFLKSQGVKEGTASYSRVVTLVYSWRLKLNELK